MGRKCVTCQHPKYQKINRLLVEGRTPLSSISRQFGMSVDSLRNHQRRCLHTNLIKAQQQRDQDYAEELWGVLKKSVTRLANNVDDLEDVIAQTKKSKHYSTLIKALNETRATLELAYKMMVSISATQRAEENIEWLLHDNEILQELSTVELRVFRKIMGMLTNRTTERTITIQDTPIVEVNGKGALAEDDDDLDDEDDYESLMVRTRFPEDGAEDIDQDSSPQANSRDQNHDPEAVVEEEACINESINTPQPKEKWRPRGVPMSMIHFESGVARAA